jgi:hypothetical protein
MIYFLLLIIIGLIAYNSFFTLEKREQRHIRRAQKIFNTPLYPNAVEFVENDERNDLYADEIVKLGMRYITRKEAVNKLAETRKKYPNLKEEEIQIVAQL